ncbi:MAG: nucleotide exchange factor GrpE [Desulfobacterales bacterium CG23_combo_of_CG06-09_8_20_14_all_51_8]|nr:MAG: nucleotide exchange factor GrpE [Desulfobacterales bacterium CG23_combo_of_CG06-09_8_20_14_all_51_8]
MNETNTPFAEDPSEPDELPDELNDKFDEELPDEFTDAFEIGIPIEETLAAPKDADLPDSPTADPMTGGAESEPGPGEDGVTAAETDATPAQIPDRVDEIKSLMENLAQAFETKLKYDAHKNKIIDDLHQALQDHREGLIKKYLHRIVTDIIKVVDDVRKFTSHHKNQPASDETMAKLINYMETIASDLEDLFSWEGVTPFTCDGDTIDLSRQRIIQRIVTDDPEKDKTIAERLRPGYEWDGKIIRPEMISAFIYQTESVAEDNITNDRTN